MEQRTLEEREADLVKILKEYAGQFPMLFWPYIYHDLPIVQRWADNGLWVYSTSLRAGRLTTAGRRAFGLWEGK